MSDRELWDALSVLARRMGLIERGQRIVIEGDPREEPAEPVQLCLAHGKYREVRLLCTYAKGHITGDILAAPSAHSWERAMVGKSPCMATSHFATTPGVTVHQCERPTRHAGEHKATGTDGVRWTWGDAPAAEATGVLGTVCGQQVWGTNGHRGNAEDDPTEPRAS